MNKKAIPILNIFSFIPLALIVFGMISLGAFAAPVIFRTVLPRHEAAETMTVIFLNFYAVSFSCILIVMAVEVIKFFLSNKKELIKSKLWIIKTLSIFAVFALVFISNFELAPKINEMRLENKEATLWNEPEFVSLHRRSESYAKLIFLFGIIPLGIMVSTKK